MERYRLIATCVDDRCNCLDKKGVIIYDGDSLEDTCQAVRQTCKVTSGYKLTLEVIKDRTPKLNFNGQVVCIPEFTN